MYSITHPESPTPQNCWLHLHGNWYLLEGRRLAEIGWFELNVDTNKGYIPLYACLYLYSFLHTYSIEKIYISFIYCTWYVCPFNMRMRSMLPADLPAVADIAMETFWSEEVFAWLFPHRPQFPEDFKNKCVDVFRFHLYKPSWHCFVSGPKRLIRYGLDGTTWLDSQCGSDNVIVMPLNPGQQYDFSSCRSLCNNQRIFSWQGRRYSGRISFIGSIMVTE